MKVIPISEIDKNMVTEFFTSHWGSPQMITSSGVFQCDELEGYAAVDEKDL
ncbi:hypothetical protein [Calorimonas adulescens]|uniref:hypothetical protein n=1 Tax=Calorimonas adulescens TaxID=2606906 RepID=UPI001396B2E0|nr:hypothetical protein [Calorimonas adulescens]